eukprot:CAMPEP_0202087084 /NCGR_PEP_ID=MMETSP0964-20121228/35218_1 /ASSEMBLY_ACC=CAM_ASM_000500 /TAXON_ID=4773 /ORGANISM="Schizochytrium aggregatum, Strain ATCC28209" /LENGTH=49 /DNA_ID= /DNA_START= /DNA_END= /DNA_ORIENTATION=
MSAGINVHGSCVERAQGVCAASARELGRGEAGWGIKVDCIGRACSARAA